MVQSVDDPQHPIDLDAVRKDLEEIARQGFRHFSLDSLHALPGFIICHRLMRPDIVTPDGFSLSADSIRESITRYVKDIPENLVRRPVAEAILGMDDETAGLTLEGRQTVAGQRYSPSKPVSFHAIRKKPYGQQPKLITYLAETFIYIEHRERALARPDYSDWDADTPLPDDGTSIAVVMTEDGPNTTGGIIRDQADAPALLSDSELEAALGYRWLEYERNLIVSHDLAKLTVTTRVLLQIKARGTRLFVHRLPTWTDLGITFPEPTVQIEPASDCAPITYVGRAQHSGHHPTWSLDYFDFGPGCEYDEQLRLTFQHIYNNPRRHIPHALSATPEFDEVQSFWLTAGRLLEDGETSEAFNDPYFAYCPTRGKQYALLIHSPGDLVRYHLRDLADWPRFNALRQKIEELEDTIGELDIEMRSLLQATETDSGEFDKSG